MKLKHLLTTIALTLGATLIPKNANSYAVKSENGDPSIHPLLVEKLKELYQPPTGIKFNTKTVKQGAIEEDSPESVYTRSYNHFISWENPNDGLWDFPSSKKWAQSPELQGGSIPFDKFPEPLRAYYVALYSGTEGVYPYGDNSWPRVKEDYAQGEIGISFGHIFHLICDATVPAHVRMDPHFGDSAFLEQLTEGSYFQVSLWPSDAYEVWTDEHKGKIMDWLAPKKENIPQFDSLGALFDDLAKFTGSNFYSDDRVDGTVKDLEEITEGKKVYFMKEVDGKYVHVLRKGFFSDFPDIKCLEDEWMVLGTKSLEYGAAALELLAKEACKSECSQNGQKVCDGNGWKECGDYDGNGCFEWSEINNCLSTEYCGEGTCHQMDVPDVQSYPDTYISPDTYVSPDTFTQICTPGEIMAFSYCWNGTDKGFNKCSADGSEWNTGTNKCYHSDCEGNVCMPTEGDTPDTCLDDWDCEGCVNECLVNGFYSCSDSGTFWYKCGEYDNDSCKDLTKINCVPGELCNESTKGCEPSCEDGCVYNAGTVGLYCNENKIMLCGYDTLEDKCLIASVFLDCGSGKTCVDLECVDICTSECETVGWYCESNKVMFCDNYDTDTCLEKKIGETCAPNEVCTPEWGCEESCTPKCTAAENKTCSGSNYIECYDKDADSCLEKTVTACAVGTTCTAVKGCVATACNATTCPSEKEYACGGDMCKSNYQCVNNSCECKDVWCLPTYCDGSPFCNNSSEVLQYIDVNSDGCIDRKSISCATGTTCKDGACVGDCTPECTAAENKTCSGSNYIECYDKDADSCLEKTVNACAVGTTCTVGKGCVAPTCTLSNCKETEYSCEDGICKSYYHCVDDACVCGDKCTASSFCETKNVASDTAATCADFNNDGCIDVKRVDCVKTYGTTCKDGACGNVPACTYECFAPSKTCMNNDVIYECGNFDADECLELKYTSCVGSGTCKDGKCTGAESCTPNEYVTLSYCWNGAEKDYKVCKSDGSGWTTGSKLCWHSECDANGLCIPTTAGGDIPDTCATDIDCATSCDDLSNGCGDADCVFYDEFSGSSLDTACKWDTIGFPTVSGGNLHITKDYQVGTKLGIFDSICNNSNFTLEYRAKLTNSASFYSISISGLLGPKIMSASQLGVNLYCTDGDGGNYVGPADITKPHTVTLTQQNSTLILTIVDSAGKSNSKTIQNCNATDFQSLGMSAFNATDSSELMINYVKVKCP